MKPLQALRQILIVLFVLAFLADAINVDEVMGFTSFQRDDSSIADDVPGIVTTSSTDVPLRPLSFSLVAPKSQKAKLELVDVDSPSLEALWVSRDEMTTYLQKTDAFVFPLSACTQINFYSLCKIQI